MGPEIEPSDSYSTITPFCPVYNIIINCYCYDVHLRLGVVQVNSKIHWINQCLGNNSVIIGINTTIDGKWCQRTCEKDNELVARQQANGQLKTPCPRQDLLLHVRRLQHWSHAPPIHKLLGNQVAYPGSSLDKVSIGHIIIRPVLQRW